jgi:hypothetical protein
MPHIYHRMVLLSVTRFDSLGSLDPSTMSVTFTVVETQEELDELEESGYFEQTCGGSSTGFGSILATAVAAVSVLLLW